jgi:hypothetical protein
MLLVKKKKKKAWAFLFCKCLWVGGTVPTLFNTRHVSLWHLLCGFIWCCNEIERIIVRDKEMESDWNQWRLFRFHIFSVLKQHINAGWKYGKKTQVYTNMPVVFPFSFFFLYICNHHKILTPFGLLTRCCSWKCRIHRGTSNQSKISDILELTRLLYLAIIAWNWSVTLVRIYFQQRDYVELI